MRQNFQSKFKEKCKNSNRGGNGISKDLAKIVMEVGRLMKVGKLRARPAPECLLFQHVLVKLMCATLYRLQL